MSNMIIVKPFTLPGVTASRGTGAANLLTPDPKEVFQDTTTGSLVTLRVDFGSAIDWDTVMIGGMTAPAAFDTWEISGGTAFYATPIQLASTPMTVSSTAAGPFSAVFYSPTLINSRYLQLSFARTTGFGTLNIGVLVVGKAFKPTWNREWGSGRKVIDTSGKQRLRGGGFGISRGAKMPGYQWTFGDLTDAEVETLYALALDCGESDPILVVENPTAAYSTPNGTHYGLLNRIDAYEREDPDLNRWALSMEEWR